MADSLAWEYCITFRRKNKTNSLKTSSFNTGSPMFSWINPVNLAAYLLGKGLRRICFPLFQTE